MTTEYEGGEYERTYHGKYKGYVRDNLDPESRGRVRLFCPQIMGGTDSGDLWLDWAEPCFPWLGGLTAGDLGPPLTREQQIADFGSEWYGVWVEFQQGQCDFPIWVGTFVVAPLPTAESALGIGFEGGAGQIGGGVINGALLPAGSAVDPINPPQSEPGREVRLRAPIGVDLVIGNEAGGYIILGASGAHITGAQVTLNGAPVLASSVKMTK